jgi:hypothetical protein
MKGWKDEHMKNEHSWMNSTHDDVDDDAKNDDSDDVGDIICDIPCLCWFDHKELGSRQKHGDID